MNETIFSFMCIQKIDVCLFFLIGVLFSLKMTPTKFIKNFKIFSTFQVLICFCYFAPHPLFDGHTRSNRRAKKKKEEKWTVKRKIDFPQNLLRFFSRDYLAICEAGFSIISCIKMTKFSRHSVVSERKYRIFCIFLCS